jgi:hypothetical protein
LFSSVIYKWLDVSLDYGITEERFWRMTLAEVLREINSRKRMQIEQAKEKASFDYILADLIGRSNARLHSSSNRLPSIAEAYPSLFVADEIAAQQQKRKEELSALRFKQFAASFNKRFKERGKNGE